MRDHVIERSGEDFMPLNCVDLGFTLSFSFSCPLISHARNRKKEHRVREFSFSG